MMCPSCGYEDVSEGARFCSSCGQLLPPEPVVSFSGYISERTSAFVGREWVFREIDDWLGDPKGSRVFLLTGEPGCGKTAIASRLVQFSQGAAESPEGCTHLVPLSLSAYHFCSARESLWTDPYTFTESLALQLSRWPAYAAELIAQAEQRGASDRRPLQMIHLEVGQIVDEGKAIGAVNFIDKVSISHESAQDAFVRAVRRPLDMLGREKSPPQVVILVDALDEALGKPGETGIVSLLAESEVLPANVRLLLTTRTEERVESQFADSDGLVISSRRHRESNQTDLRDYVTHRFNEDEDLADEVTKLVEEVRQAAIEEITAKATDDLREAGDREEEIARRVGEARQAAVGEITAKAAGNFRYARFFLDAVAAGRRSLAELQDLPEGLDGLYFTSLDRLVKLGEKDWASAYSPFMGVLSVAQTSLSLDQLLAFTGQEEEVAWANLGDLQQFLEDVTPEDAAAEEVFYQLYHQSVVDFLRRRFWKDKRKRHRNTYYLPAVTWHGRIADSYLSRYRDDWSNCDGYGLRHLAGHLRTRLDLEKDDDKRAKLAKELYDLVLDEGFREAQQEILGDLSATLADLGRALDVALENDNLVKVLACAGAYRDTIRSQSMAVAIFAAVDAGNLDTALRRAELYSQTPDWARVLNLYLAWESALRGDEARAQDAAAQGLAQPSVVADDLCDALAVHTARILSQRSAGREDVDAWFLKLHPSGDAQHTIPRYGPAEPISPKDRNKLLELLDERLRQLQYVAADEYGPEGAAELLVLDDEERAAEMASLGNILAQAAADSKGREKLAIVLDLILPNPYPQYRDIALDALGVAVLATAEPAWAQHWLRRILYAGLDQEGVTFTFDLPSMLVAEAERRGRAALQLRHYLDSALNSQDRWGTSVRAHSARAAAQFRLGNRDEARAALRHAAQLPTGFAGFATITLLSLANRWLEFGQPDEASGDLNKVIQDAAMWAGKVNDTGLRMRREALVEEYETWLPEEVPAFEHATAKLLDLPDRGTHRTYKDYVSARWTSQPDEANLEALKALVLWTVVDGTRLDSVLGRLAGLLIRKLGEEGLSDQQLDEAIAICQKSLATGKPWEQKPLGPT